MPDHLNFGNPHFGPRPCLVMLSCKFEHGQKSIFMNGQSSVSWPKGVQSLFRHGREDRPALMVLIMEIPVRQVYYYNKQAQRTEVRGCWCHSCWNEAKEGLVQLDGSTVPKKDLDKRKNDEEVRGAAKSRP